MTIREQIETAFKHREELNGLSRFYLIGVGGAGMSSLALIATEQGFEVAGVDAYRSATTDHLIFKGLDVAVGHSSDVPFWAEALILSDAVNLETSPEVQEAQKRGLPLFRRSQFLSFLLRHHRVIAVTGTHGKSTMTGLLGSALIGAGIDPFVIVGAEVPQFGGAVVRGKGEWAVVEACEAYNGMLDLDPEMVVLTNLEMDHVDFHGDFDHLRASMMEFVKKLPKRGKLIYAEADAGACEIARLSGVDSEPYRPDPTLAKIALFGNENRLNAAGAKVAAEKILGGPLPEKGLEALRSFRGVHRRLEVLRDDSVTVIDDYAHHPTEISSSLRAVRDRYLDRRLVVVYQPHLYSRTKDLLKETSEALNLADKVVLTDIYPAREAQIPGISSALIGELVTKPTVYVPSRHLLPRIVAGLLEPQDVVVGMGAGSIGEFAPELVAELESHGDLRPTFVMVAFGGDSSEREVSLSSGRAIAAALETGGYRVELVDLSEKLLSQGNLSMLVGPNRPDVVFLAVHGNRAEDGAIQGLLELAHIPYTGSGIQASALAMDKAAAKSILADAGLRVPKGQVVKSPADVIEIQGPWVVKPNAEGSTVGVSFVRNEADLASAVRKALAFGSECLVEEMIEGVEISVPYLIDRVLPPVEIVPLSGVYDFASKYQVGATEEICPARLSQDLYIECQRIAECAHKAVRAAGATRTDIIVRGTEVVVLEINTLPGMTATSLLPTSAAAAGIQFPELCRMIVEDALVRHGAKAQK